MILKKSIKFDSIQSMKIIKNNKTLKIKLTLNKKWRGGGQLMSTFFFFFFGSVKKKKIVI